MIPKKQIKGPEPPEKDLHGIARLPPNRSSIKFGPENEIQNKVCSSLSTSSNIMFNQGKYENPTSSDHPTGMFAGPQSTSTQQPKFKTMRIAISIGPHSAVSFQPLKR